MPDCQGANNSILAAAAHRVGKAATSLSPEL
jgi:hypothetical protein